MKICFFTKYPPIEGGVASQSYWLARALGEQGVEVHIVTNALEEKIWREKINFEDDYDLMNYQPPGVYVHSLDSVNIDTSRGQNIFLKQSPELRLASLGIEVIERYNCDIIDSHYLLPYGVAAYLAKKETDRPLILRHAGSDIDQIVSRKTLLPFFRKIFPKADLIFTRQEQSSFFERLGVLSEKIFLDFSFGVDPQYFNSEVSPADLIKYGLNVPPGRPIITYIGKIGRAKGIYELAEAASEIKEDFLLLFVAGGPGLDEFKEYIEQFPNLKGKYQFFGFVPPWRIPSILKKSHCLVQLERDFPVAFHASILSLEGLAVGVCLLISEDIYEIYKNLAGAVNGKSVLVVNPKNISELKKSLKEIIQNQGLAKKIGEQGLTIFDKNLFSNSVSVTIKTYEALFNKNKSLKACLDELRQVILKYLSML